MDAIVYSFEYLEYAERIRSKARLVINGENIQIAEVSRTFGKIRTLNPNPYIRVEYNPGELGDLQFSLSLRNFLREEKIPYTENMTAPQAVREFLKQSGLQTILDEEPEKTVSRSLDKCGFVDVTKEALKGDKKR